MVCERVESQNYSQTKAHQMKNRRARANCKIISQIIKHLLLLFQIRASVDTVSHMPVVLSANISLLSPHIA